MSDLWLLPRVKKVASLAERQIQTVFIETLENQLHMSIEGHQSKSLGTKRTPELPSEMVQLLAESKQDLLTSSEAARTPASACPLSSDGVPPALSLQPQRGNSVFGSLNSETVLPV